MAKWNISDADAKTREAAFEAKVMAELALAKPAGQVAAPKVAPVVPVPAVSPTDGIQISLTANGQTTRYESLESVPLPVRQRIVTAWLGFPQPTGVPPVLVTPPLPAAPATRSTRTAFALNLFLPGAGQFYLGQPGWGAFYALSFLGCFVAMIVIFIRGYVQMDTGTNILETGNLEKLAETFHAGILGALQAVALLIYLASTVHLFLSRHRR